MTHSGSILKTQHSGLSTVGPRGSVLLFAIVLLAMLAMLGTTFILFVRQSKMSSTNTEINIETDAATQAGFIQAQQTLRNMVSKHAIAVRKSFQTTDAMGNVINEYHVGVYAPLSATYTYLDTDFEAWATGGGTVPPVDIAFWHFENNVPGGSGPVLSAPSGGSGLRFTTSPLAARESNGSEIAQLTELQGYTNDLYKYPLPLNNPIKQTQRVSSVRGDYAGWISDLDAKLYAISTSWGIDVSNVPGAAAENALRLAILNFEYIDVAGNDHSLSPSLSADLMAATPTSPTNDGRFPHFRSNQELSLSMPSIQNALDANAYQQLRQQLEYYFSVYLDTPNAGSVVKDGSAAININTAPVEVIAAAISQIPTDTDGEMLYGIDGGRAYRIAQRIVAKRPFLCRMDFEDFLAAHLKGTGGVSGDPSAAPPTDLRVGDPIWSTPSDPIWSQPPLTYMVYYAMGKRWGPGGRVLASNGTTVVGPQLSLSQYLEIQGVQDTDPAFKKTINGHDSWPNYPEYQIERFKYFFGTTTERAALTDEYLTGKEFNNIINSVTSGGGTADNDDVQVKPPDPNAALNPSDFVISPGPDGVLGSFPSGDDEIVIHIKPTPATLAAADTVNDQIINGMIYPGPDNVIDSIYDTAAGDVEVVDGIVAGDNGIAESFVRYNRPSYYSYFEDSTYSGADAATYGFWDKIDKTVDLSVNPTTDQIDFDGVQRLKADVETEAIAHMKFYYRLKPAPAMPANSPRPDATLFDLLSWSCLPLHSEETHGRSGFYQMTFDDWTVSWGPLQSSSDQSFFDPAAPDTTYSTANQFSGKNFNGDVAWSPQIAFRSRYFGIYVLGRGKVQGWNTPELNPDDPQLRSRLKIAGERRLEAVYDALKDEVIWQRTPVSEKRSLAEP